MGRISHQCSTVSSTFFFTLVPLSKGFQIGWLFPPSQPLLPLPSAGPARLPMPGKRPWTLTRNSGRLPPASATGSSPLPETASTTSPPASSAARARPATSECFTRAAQWPQWETGGTEMGITSGIQWYAKALPNSWWAVVLIPLNSNSPNSLITQF